MLDEAVDQGAFPGAVVEVGRSDAVLWRHAVGRLSADSDSPSASVDTVYDLASLTKVIVTTTLAMKAVDEHGLSLDDRVSDRVSAWRGSDRTDVTIRDLLAHASGLTAHLPFFRDHKGRAEYERAIATMPLEYPPRSKSVYSDLGFILLGFILEDVYGAKLDGAFTPLAARMAWEELRFTPPSEWRRRVAPTEVDAWRGRLLVGEVHDENAWALGGVAGHSGLFGTATAVGLFARTVASSFRSDAARLATPDTFGAFMTRTDVPRSSRALGWDTMRPTSSCGTRLSPAAVGHTGFTGTSLWIDPTANLYVVCLTNRVHPSRSNNAILTVRPSLHDAIVHDLASSA